MRMTLKELKTFAKLIPLADLAPQGVKTNVTILANHDGSATFGPWGYCRLEFSDFATSEAALAFKDVLAGHVKIGPNVAGPYSAMGRWKIELPIDCFDLARMDEPAKTA